MDKPIDRRQFVRDGALLIAAGRVASAQAEGAKPDYIIYQFSELRQAVEFFESM